MFQSGIERDSIVIVHVLIMIIVIIGWNVFATSSTLVPCYSRNR